MLRTKILALLALLTTAFLFAGSAGWAASTVAFHGQPTLLAARVHTDGFIYGPPMID
jgi:hypothetical protein